jgi:Tol biopolymer transport system component
MIRAIVRVRQALTVAFLLSFVIAWNVQPLTAQSTNSPEVFAPGMISGSGGDGAPSFTPDGNTLFFTRSAARWSVILESHRVHGQWSKPAIASFSGEWSDASPAVAPDGSFLVFVSVRPLDTTTQGESGGTRKMASHIWRVNHEGAGWGAPVQLPDAVNFCPNIFRPSVAADGTIYFTVAEKGKELRLFRSIYQNGVYGKAEALSFSDGTVKDVDPEIAPDQSFLIFSSRRWPNDTVHEHLFIAFNKAGTWGEITPMHYAGDDANGSSDDNDPRLSPDHHTVYFSSDRSPVVHFPRTKTQAEDDVQRMEAWDNGNTNIWTMPLTPWLHIGS